MLIDGLNVLAYGHVHDDDGSNWCACHHVRDFHWHGDVSEHPLDDAFHHGNGGEPHEGGLRLVLVAPPFSTAPG